MMGKSMAEEFDSYLHEVIPAEAPLEQRKECELAFMAGGAAAVRLIAHTSIEEVAAQLKAWFDETERLRAAGL